MDNCGRCHDCGNELRVVLDGEGWCGVCGGYRRFRSHGWAAGDDNSACLSPYQVRLADEWHRNWDAIIRKVEEAVARTNEAVGLLEDSDVPTGKLVRLRDNLRSMVDSMKITRALNSPHKRPRIAEDQLEKI